MGGGCEPWYTEFINFAYRLYTKLMNFVYKPGQKPRRPVRTPRTRMVLEVHAADADTYRAGVVPLGKKDLELGKLAKFEGYLEPDEMEALRGYIDRIPEVTTLVHGDIHGRNVLVQGDELLLIDMESITHGHHAWGVAHTCFTYWNLSQPMSQEGLCEMYLGVPPETAAAISRAFLEKTFPDLAPSRDGRGEGRGRIFGRAASCAGASCRARSESRRCS